MAGARRSRAEWEQLVREAESGGTIADVARRHGVRPRTLTWWRWQLRRGKVARSATKAVQMVPVRVREVVRPAVDDVVEVLVRGAGVRVRGGPDPRYVAELAAALAARC
jgi:transposase-like protein